MASKQRAHRWRRQALNLKECSLGGRSFTNSQYHDEPQAASIRRRRFALGYYFAVVVAQLAFAGCPR
jgi:hypothetical protein